MALAAHACIFLCDRHWAPSEIILKMKEVGNQFFAKLSVVADTETLISLFFFKESNLSEVSISEQKSIANTHH